MIRSTLARALAALVALAAPAATAEEAAPDAVPELSRVLSMARERAPSIARARGETRVARAGYEGARLSQLTNPYLEVQAQHGRGGATRDVQVQASLWVPVEVSGQRGRRIAEVDAHVALADEALAAVRASAMADAVRAYGEVATGEARVKALEAAVTVSKEQAHIFEERVAVHDSTVADLHLANLEVARNTVELIEARADLSRALAELARATGVAEYRPTEGLSLRPPAAPQRGPQIERALAGSPMVTVLDREAIYFSRVRDRQAREAQVPLNLILIGGRGDLGETRLGLGMSWTLPTFRVNQTERARAEADRLRAVSERDARRRSIEASLRGISAQRAELGKAIEVMSGAGVRAAEESVEAAAALHRAGKGEVLRVFSARRDLVHARTRVAELALKEWQLAADAVLLTGEAP
ncbi:MAG: TolC family protein [Polyangiaceae bacterium]|nr:TolC family protein [Polyangiaceae bacterium]